MIECVVGYNKIKEGGIIVGRKKKTETTEEAIVKEEKKAKPKTKKKTEPKVATKKDRTPKKRLTEQEIKEWDDLYQYVRLKVLGYDENQSLPKFFVLRLKGLLVNKFLETYDVEDTANYSYATILNTFRYCALDIQWALKNVSFRDESHKLNNMILQIQQS